MINRMTLTVVCLFILTACNNAVATDPPEKQPEIKPVTRAECLAMEVKENKIACFKKLSAQRKAELEATQKRIKDLERENQKRRERNEVLLNEFEKGVLGED